MKISRKPGCLTRILVAFCGFISIFYKGPRFSYIRPHSYRIATTYIDRSQAKKDMRQGKPYQALNLYTFYYMHGTPETGYIDAFFRDRFHHKLTISDKNFIVIRVWQKTAAGNGLWVSVLVGDTFISRPGCQLTPLKRLFLLRYLYTNDLI